jgi:hypothetical protein
MAGAGAEIRICASVKPEPKEILRLRNTNEKTTMIHSLIPLRRIWLRPHPLSRRLE